MTALVGYPYVEKIEKVKSDRDKFFPVLNYGESHSFLLSLFGIEKRFGRRMWEIIQK